MPRTFFASVPLKTPTAGMRLKLFHQIRLAAQPVHRRIFAMLLMRVAFVSLLSLGLTGSLLLVPSSGLAASFAGTQTGPTEWTYVLTIDPYDNFAVCPPPGDVATITLTGLSGVNFVTAPTSFDPDSAWASLSWTPEILNGGTQVRWTHLGPGTGNWDIPIQVLGFKVYADATVANGRVIAVTDGFSIDVSATGPCPVQPADDRDFIGVTDGPMIALDVPITTTTGPSLTFGPNPVVPSTRLRGNGWAGGQPVEIALYDLNGREIVRSGTQSSPAGAWEISWSSLLGSQEQAVGIYFVHVGDSHHHADQKVIVLR